MGWRTDQNRREAAAAASIPPCTCMGSIGGIVGERERGRKEDIYNNGEPDKKSPAPAAIRVDRYVQPDKG